MDRSSGQSFAFALLDRLARLTAPTSPGRRSRDDVRHRALALAWLALWVVAALGLGPSPVRAQVIERVSIANDGSPGGSPIFFNAVISANGRVVAFESLKTNLDPRANGLKQIYVRDRLARRTTLITVTPDGQAAGNSSSFNPTLSGDGRFVAFQSKATNLVAGAIFGIWQVYVHDRVTGTTTLASTPDGVTPGNGDSQLPRVSADGRVVAFEGPATNLASVCASGYQIFVRDLASGTTTCVSVAPDGSPGNGVSEDASLSADGSIVAFDSFATNLAGSCTTTGVRQIFVLDRVSGTMQCVSLAVDGTSGNDWSESPALSGDGRVVVFNSFATNLVAPCTNGFSHVLVRDLASGATACVTVTPNGKLASNADSFDPAVSADGRFVTFASKATNLVSIPVFPLIYQVYIHDRLRQQTTLVSMAADGTVGTGTSFLPSVTGGGGDGRLIAFASFATNLLPGDTGGMVQFEADAYVARLAVGPNWLVGAPASGAPVRGFDALGGATKLDKDAGLAGGVQVALGDVNGDGAPDLIVGAGNAPGQDPRVRVFSGSTAETLLVDFDANAGAPGGVRVAGCDLGGTGRVHIVTGPGPGGGTQVRVWSFDPATSSVTELASFPAYATSPGGVFVACGFLDGPNAAPSIITGPGPGSAPLVKVFSVDVGGGTATERTSFEAYPASFTGGVSVAAGDVRRRGRASIITGTGPGSPPLVRVWTLGLAPLTAGLPGPRQVSDTVTDDGSVVVGNPDSVGGINVGAGDTTGVGETVVTGSGPGDPSQISTVDFGGTTPGEPVPISLPGTGGVVPAAPPGTGSLPPLAPPPVGVQLNHTSFQPGDLFSLDGMVENPGPAVVVDVYLAVALPVAVGPTFGCPSSRALVFVTSEGLVLTCLSAPETFPPLFRQVTVPAALPLTPVPGLLALAIPGGAPAGNYIVALALTVPNTLNVLTLTTTGFAIVP